MDIFGAHGRDIDFHSPAHRFYWGMCAHMAAGLDYEV